MSWNYDITALINTAKQSTKQFKVLFDCNYWVVTKAKDISGGAGLAFAHGKRIKAWSNL